MPLPRFTLRRLMVAVAVAGTILDLLAKRRSRFSRLAVDHDVAARAPTIMWPLADEQGRPVPAYYGDANAEWNLELSLKYARAARYPWLPVAPDPPEPK